MRRIIVGMCGWFCTERKGNMTPKQVKKKLQSIRHLRTEIKAVEEQMEYVRVRAEYQGGWKSGNTVKGGNDNKQEELLINLLTFEEQLANKKDALIKAEQEGEQLLNFLSDEEARFRVVLRERFILCRTQEQTAELLNYSWRQIVRTEWRAICLIAKRCHRMS